MCGALQALLSTPEMTDYHAGELVIGGIDGPKGEKYYSGDILYSPLVQEKWYNVIVTDISVGGASLEIECSRINSPRVSTLQ
jgi:hypothetical protein